MRLIDADEIRNKLKRKEINPATIFINEVLIGLLDDAPTVDAVRVVRCEDCRFFDKHYVGFGYNVCHKLNQMMHENDYCSCGERGGSQWD